MSGPLLTTDRLTLRQPGNGDATAMIGFFAEERSQFYGGPKDEGLAWRDFAARVGHWALRGFGMFAVVERAGNETVGLVGPWQPSDFPEPEMSWLITAARHEGKGYAREAGEAVLANIFATHGWTSLPSFIDHDNDASLTLARRLGAKADPTTPSPIAGCATWRHFAPGSAT